MKNVVLKNRFDDYLDYKMNELKNETEKYFADKYANELVGYITAAVDLNFITQDISIHAPTWGATAKYKANPYISQIF